MAFTQSRQIDSLKQLLVNSKEDTNKVNILYNIGEAYWLGLPDTIDIPHTISYTEEALLLAQKLRYIPGEINGLMCLGNVYAYSRKLPESKKYFNEAVVVVNSLMNKKKSGDILTEIASDFQFYGNDAKNYLLYFPETFHYAFQALKAYEDIGDTYDMAKIWMLIGKTYSWQNFFNLGKGNEPEVEKCGLQAMTLLKQSKETTANDVANCQYLIARGYYYQARYAKALELFLAALKVYEKDGNKSIIASTYLNIGRVYKGMADSTLEKGDHSSAGHLFNEAIRYFELALKLHTELNEFAFIALCHFYIGEIQIALKNHSIAKEHLYKAITYTDKVDGGTYQDIYKCLAKVDSAEGNFPLALQHYKMYTSYKESQSNEAIIIQSEGYKMKYEFAKKEDSLKQKQLITETKLNIQKKQRYFYWAGILLLALLSFFVFLNFRNQKKLNRLAAEKYAREKAELQLQSLRAQLNPHFIFNCINSIDAFIHNNDTYNATLYLNKFARLLRNILDSSRQATVPFTKDIETLKLYIELEEFRNEKKFTTHIHIDRELLENDYKVPTLIIQPFVENAILHGLKNKAGSDGLLNIDIKKVEDNIEYSIQDNGIGRKAASKIAQNKQSSYGMQLSHERIRLFNREKEASVKITDLENEGNATGTLITASLKIM
jgi:tetratricopeptide (TPR) repeat protein